jgi:hypothetical protein
MRFHDNLLHDMLHAKPDSSESVRMFRVYAASITTGSVEISLWQARLIMTGIEQKLGFLGMAEVGTTEGVFACELRDLRDHLNRRIAAAREAAIAADRAEHLAALRARFPGEGLAFAH